jgi:hypothetical protein
MQKISKTREWSTLIIGLFFVSILTFGFIDDYIETGTVKWFVLVLIIFFLSITIWRLKMIYRVFKKEDSLMFVNVLTRKTFVLHKNENVEVDANLYISPFSDLSRRQTIVLKTEEKCLELSIESYRNFYQILDEIFATFPNLEDKYSEQLKLRKVKEKMSNRNYEIAFVIISIIVSIIWYNYLR